jgi:hypothetical protein
MTERFPTPANKEDKEGAKDTLRWIANKILDKDGVSILEELLFDDEIEKAKEFLLGKTDQLFEGNHLNFEQAAELYTLIGVSLERASQLRQSRATRTAS